MLGVKTLAALDYKGCFDYFIITSQWLLVDADNG